MRLGINQNCAGNANRTMPKLSAGGIFIFLPGKGGALSKKPKAGGRQINYLRVRNSAVHKVPILLFSLLIIFKMTMCCVRVLSWSATLHSRDVTL